MPNLKLSLKELLAQTINQKFPDLKPYLDTKVDTRQKGTSPTKRPAGRFQLMSPEQIARYYCLTEEQVCKLDLPWIYFNEHSPRLVYFVCVTHAMAVKYGTKKDWNVFSDEYPTPTAYVRDLHLGNGANPKLLEPPKDTSNVEPSI